MDFDHDKGKDHGARPAPGKSFSDSGSKTGNGNPSFPRVPAKSNGGSTGSDRSTDAKGSGSKKPKPKTSNGKSTGISEKRKKHLETKANTGLRVALFSNHRSNMVLNEKLIDDFCHELRSCIFTELAADACGIAINSLKEWLRQGRKVHEYLSYHAQMSDAANMPKEHLQSILDEMSEADWLTFKLYTDYKQARYEGEKDDLDFIARARAKDWKAAAYRLKIRNRERYGEGEKNQVNINTGSGSIINGGITVVDYSQWILGDESGESIEIEAETVDEIPEG